MNKKLSIFAVILIIVGLVGTVWSGINTIPYFMNEISRLEQESMKEETIYNKDVLNIKKVIVQTKDCNVKIKRNNENKIKVSKTGNQDYAKYDFDNNNNILTIKESYINKNNDVNNLDFKTLFNNLFESAFSFKNDEIIIYLPNNIDLEVITYNGNLEIENGIELKNIAFKTLLGWISLPKEVKNIENLQILSSSNISLDVMELLGIKNLNIECNDLNIYSNDNYMLIDNIENYIPLNLDIVQYNSDEANVNIESNIPIAKNLNIKGNNSVYLQIPIEKYKINFDISVSDNIYLNNDIFIENNVGDNLKQIKGILNKGLENLNDQYNITIKSKILEIN